jgi:hypothetical protein
VDALKVVRRIDYLIEERVTGVHVVLRRSCDANDSKGRAVDASKDAITMIIV